MAAYETEWLKDSVDVVVANGMNVDGSLAVEKLEAMKKAADDKPLAVVGDFSLEHLVRLDGIADEILITKNRKKCYGSSILDRQRTEELVELAHFLVK
jgi:predicted TIM-barrel enzyme